MGDRAQIYDDLSVPPDIAASLATALDTDMGRCMLTLYRSAPREALDALAGRVPAAERRPGLVIDPTEDPYLSSALAQPVAERLGAEGASLPGEGHWWMFDDVGPIADRLVAFWRRG